MNDKKVQNKEMQEVVKTELRMDEVHENLKPTDPDKVQKDAIKIGTIQSKIPMEEFYRYFFMS